MQQAIRAQSGTIQRTVPGEMVSSIVTKIEPSIKLVNNSGCILHAVIPMQQFYQNVGGVILDRFIRDTNNFLVGGTAVEQTHFVHLQHSKLAFSYYKKKGLPKQPDRG